MKKLVAGFLILGSMSTYAEEVPLRLTSKNISRITSSLVKECTPKVDVPRFLTATYRISIKLTDGKTVKVTFNKDSLDDCSNAQSEVTMNGRSLLNKLNDIQNSDLSVDSVGDHLVCKQVVGNIVYDTETNAGTNFEKKAVVVKCP